MKKTRLLFVCMAVILLTAGPLKSQVLWHADPNKGLREVFYRLDITGYTSGSYCLDRNAPNPTASTPTDGTYGKHWQLYKPKGRKRAEFARSNGFQPKENDDFYLGWRWRISSNPNMSNGLAIFQCKTEAGTNNPSTQNYPFGMGYDGKYLDISCYGPGYPDWTVGSSITNRRTTIWRKEVPSGTWVTLVLHIKISRDKNIGFVEFWYNGTKQTLMNSNYKEYQVKLSSDKKRAYHKTNDGNKVYFKWGAYGSNACAYATTTKYDELKIGKTLRDASPDGATCNSTAITPYLQVNGGAWQQTTNATINSGDAIKFGPQPVSGGSWSWSGLASGNSREVTIRPSSSGTATATYTNNCGAKSTRRFNITVNGGTTFVHMAKRNATGFAIDGGNGGANNNNIFMWDANLNNVNQQWEEIGRGSGYYSYKKRNTNYCIDGGNGGANDQNVKLWQCSNNNYNQHWRKVSTGSGHYQLLKRNASTYAIVGGPGGSRMQNIRLWPAANNNYNQQWKFSNVSSKGAEFDYGAALAIDGDKKVVLYPNPVKDYLSLTNAINAKRIVILDATAKLVKDINPRNSDFIDVSDLQNGLYFINVLTNDKQQSIKFIKE